MSAAYENLSPADQAKVDAKFMEIWDAMTPTDRQAVLVIVIPQ